MASPDVTERAGCNFEDFLLIQLGFEIEFNSIERTHNSLGVSERTNGTKGTQTKKQKYV